MFKYIWVHDCNRKKTKTSTYVNSWSPLHKRNLITFDRRGKKKKKRNWHLPSATALWMRRTEQTREDGDKPVCPPWCVIWRYCGETVHQNCSSLVCFHIMQIGEGFLLCRCWIGRGLRRYLSTLRQGQGIRETSTVLPWFPVQLCLPPTPRIVVLCWPSVSHRL